MKGIEVIPSAKRLITSLRDMGYDFSQAIADIVDNSIEAGATRVAIDFEYNGDDTWVRISDNGEGMPPDRLREAMKYGSDRDYANDDLGKFGLGMKTASMSQCKCLSVASRWNPSRMDIKAYSWDLDHIEKTDRWEILPLERNKLTPLLCEPLKDTTGTVVLWRRLDRMFDYKLPRKERERSSFFKSCRDVEIHLAMVFHAFLNGEIRGTRSFKIFVNGNKIEAWDPFCRTEAKTKQLQPVVVPVEHEGIIGQMQIEPYILPHKDDFSSPDAFNRASGPAKWNPQQGFYIYRAGRMIQSGGWSKIRTPDEHTKLARIALRFSPELDNIFKINVAKMRVVIPLSIREDVEKAIGPAIKLAQEVYRRKGSYSSSLPLVQTQTEVPPQPNLVSQIHTPDLTGGGVVPLEFSESTGDSLKPNGQLHDDIKTFTIKEWSELLLNHSEPHERPVVETVLGRL